MSNKIKTLLRGSKNRAEFKEILGKEIENVPGSENLKEKYKKELFKEIVNDEDYQKLPRQKSNSVKKDIEKNDVEKNDVVENNCPDLSPENFRKNDSLLDRIIEGRRLILAGGDDNIDKNREHNYLYQLDFIEALFGGLANKNMNVNGEGGDEELRQKLNQISNYFKTKLKEYSTHEKIVSEKIITNYVLGLKHAIDLYKKIFSDISSEIKKERDPLFVKCKSILEKIESLYKQIPDKLKKSSVAPSDFIKSMNKMFSLNADSSMQECFNVGSEYKEKFSDYKNSKNKIDLVFTESEIIYNFLKDMDIGYDSYKKMSGGSEELFVTDLIVLNHIFVKMQFVFNNIMGSLEKTYSN